MEASIVSDSQPWITVPYLIDLDDPQTLHMTLHAFNRTRLQPGLPEADWEAGLQKACAATIAEGRYIEQERRQILRHLAVAAPRDADGFVAWFEALGAVGAWPVRSAVRVSR